MTAEERDAKNRIAILWWEFCCLLHDIGKLSDDFLAYRQLWHAMKGGYAVRDPHDHDWLEKDTILQDDFDELNKFFHETICDPATGMAGDLSVKNAVHNHISPKDELCRLLAAGDSFDSRYDRNNPLLGCEQTFYDHAPDAKLSSIIPELPCLYRGNVFGRERAVRGGVLDPVAADDAQALSNPPKPLVFLTSSEGDLNAARRKFYAELTRHLNLKDGGPDRTWPKTQAGYKTFRDIRDAMRTHWDQAMSDTTRPDNDTSLWEHVYSVSAVTRALLVRRLALGRPLDRGNKGDQVFTVWGFGFDSLRYLSSAHKIGDVVARKKVIAAVFDKAQQYVEYTKPYGNEVYRDENCVFFLIGHAGLLGDLQGQITADCLSESLSELLPCFAVKEGTTDLTCLPTLIEEVRREAATPTHTEGARLRIPAFEMAWPKTGKPASICPICRFRPVRARNATICVACRDRRSDAGRDRNPDQTAFLSEIVGAKDGDSGRAALIVARFGLRDWLNGKLVRTLLVTEPHGARATLEALPTFCDLDLNTAMSEWRDDRLKLPDTYEEMRKEFACVEAGVTCKETRYANLIYGRGLGTLRKGDPALTILPPELANGLFEVLVEMQKEFEGQPGYKDPPGVLNSVCGKTPTPSTLLDVWQTTLEFMEGIAGSDDPRRRKDSGWLAKSLKQRVRPWLRAGEEPKGLGRGETVDVALGGTAAELVYEGDRRFGILSPRSFNPNGLAGSTFEIPADEDRPSKTLTIADAGVEGGAAFHPFRLIAATPGLLLLLVPAEKAVEITQEIYKRYLAEFGKAWGRLPLAIGNIFFPQHTPMFSVLDAARRMERGFRHLQDGVWVETEVHSRALAAPLLLGSGETDFHHPYLRLAPNGGADRDFETIAGPIVLTSRAAGRKVLIRPNIYKPVWLGSSGARFEADCAASLEPPPHDRSFDAALPLKTWLGRTAGERGDGLPALLLDDFDKDIAGFWERMRAQGVSDSTLRNVASVLAGNDRAWRHQGADGAVMARKIALAAGHRFPDPLRLEDALNDGSFEQVIKLYVQILKQHLDNKGDSRVTNA